MVATHSTTNQQVDHDLFDTTVGYDEEVGLKLPDGLSPDEEKQARQLYNIFNELWGLVIVTGLPGTGKDLFGNIISYKCARFYPWKKIMRDEKPRSLFGKYAGLFNRTVLKEDLERMQEVASGSRSRAVVNEAMSKAADNWVAEEGEVMLKNSVLYLTEYYKYCYCRDPMNPMNKTMGAIHKVYRHLDCLVIGTVQLATDLDKHTCLPFVKWNVTATKSATNPTGFVYYITKVAYDDRRELLIPTSRPFPMAFDGGKPRSYLGDGRIKILKTWYKGVTEEEQLVLGCLKAGVDVYEDLVKLLQEQVEMSEAEVLTTLKDLKFRKSKKVIGYNDFFSLYNSKSAPQVGSKGLDA